MSDLNAVHLALRDYALDVVISTTGVAALAASAVGFTRSVGSFVADGFARGMEVTSTGFGVIDTLAGVVTSVAPTDLRVLFFSIAVANGIQTVSYPTVTPVAEGPNRILTAGLPSLRSWENDAPPGTTAFTPAADVPYIEEEFSPSTARKVGFPIKQSMTEEIGEYYLKWHGVPGTGSSAMRKGIDALKVLFDAGTVIPAGIDSVWIDSNPAPTTAGIIQTTSRPVLILSIPWIVRSRITP